jgi:hypothetical protein
MDYLQLKNEFVNDPKGYGYAEAWSSGQDWKLADLINQVHDTIKITRDTVSTYEIFDAIVPDEWDALTATEKSRIQLILSMGQVSLKGANTRAALSKAFGAGTTTRSNLIAMMTRPGSRAEELFGAGVVVTWDDIAMARRA